MNTLDSFRFAYPDLLWLLLLLPLLALLQGKKGPKAALVFSSISAMKAIAQSHRGNPGTIGLSLRLATLALLILALARPQWGATSTELEASGIDIILAVDLSGSMHALDFTLQGQSVNRLDVVKSVVQRFISQRPNDRIGLLVFAARPYLVCPLTLDHKALQQRLDAVHIGMIEDGTAIGSAIAAGVNQLREQESKSRILILLTDGVNNAGKISPLTAAEAAASMKLKVYTIGVGRRGVAPMPVVGPFGRRHIVQLEVDIDEETLTRIAEMTGAQYFRATDTHSLEKIYEEINAMEATIRNIRHFSQYRELFPWFVLAVLALLATEMVISRKRLP
jgi:Ca-activated chloride channel family protein